MAWTQHHNRGAILRDVIAVAAQRRDGLLPMDLDGVAERFTDELDLLGALQLRWHTRLAGHIEHRLAEQPMSLETAVVEAWHAAADELPGVRLVLDHYRAAPSDARMHEAMAKAVAKEHVLLAVMAGRGAYADELAATVGALIEERARAAYLPGITLPAQRPASLLDRIRAVLAA
jgi:hypothetical protein